MAAICPSACEMGRADSAPVRENSGVLAGRAAIERQYAALEDVSQHSFDIRDQLVPPPPLRPNGSAIAQFRFADRRKKQRLGDLARGP